VQAKRKAREKQLEEARRLASLQKKRELKAAGIEMRDRKRKMRSINYNAEVAFEKKPAPGFYDVGDEAERTKELGKEFRAATLEEMEGKRRKVGHLEALGLSLPPTHPVCLSLTMSRSSFEWTPSFS
jgi:pre-mRNA-splicing factor CDC5/CEF1